MEQPSKTKLTLWDGLAKMLHLPPHSNPSNPSVETNRFSTRDYRSMALEKTPQVPLIEEKKMIPKQNNFSNKPLDLFAGNRTKNISNTKPIAPAIREKIVSNPHIPFKQPATLSAPLSSTLPTNEQIITDYDKIYDLVRARKTIKLDEIARLLSLKEERVAQELQTLEDNALVEVKYPAFGEPLICYKEKEG